MFEDILVLKKLFVVLPDPLSQSISQYIHVTFPVLIHTLTKCVSPGSPLHHNTRLLHATATL